ncbi:Hexapeptide repeat of succinyl-transferase [Lutibacter oricola]|uniref:Hexapeptide repeat of succinyl-transferase n=1 Tax=Lutibacter oricola TaxID=762486 RepID=A0A1H2TPL1_9FLAO|nr:CatB-related O-acetyltransferase [Lutibacter oricola]SDW45913.1 Hexapeptide repeat of succinyl-transferase [Lutibacter oricola]
MIKKIIKYLYNNLKGIKVDFNSKIPLNIIVKDKDSRYPVSIVNSTFNNTSFGLGCKLNNCLCLGEVQLGRFVSIFGPGTVLSAIKGHIKIGSFCSIGQNVSIQESYHNYNNVSSYLIGKNILKDNDSDDFISKGNIIIEEDVWIGSNSIILSGVRIGRGSVIAAGSIVTKNVPRYSIYGGNPAKEIKKRFENSKIDIIEQSKWWEWEVNKIIENKDFFYNKSNIN